MGEDVRRGSRDGFDARTVTDRRGCRERLHRPDEATFHVVPNFAREVNMCLISPAFNGFVFALLTRLMRPGRTQVEICATRKLRICSIIWLLSSKALCPPRSTHQKCDPILLHGLQPVFRRDQNRKLLHSQAFNGFVFASFSSAIISRNDGGVPPGRRHCMIARFDFRRTPALLTKEYRGWPGAIALCVSPIASRASP